MSLPHVPGGADPLHSSSSNLSSALGDLPVTGVTDPGEHDVLCGRGGAALRHPGNLTYRRLVNLNKGLYITCLKTEKLKISRSIVAAIREQRGRFLEKDADTGTWYDIGDKKAIEKTSQALREGQPKLRQKIVEMGGAAALDGGQFAHAGIYTDQPATSGTGMASPPPQVNAQYQHLQHQAAVAAAQTAALRQQEYRTVPMRSPDARRQEMHAELFQRLSLRDLNPSPHDDHRIQQMQRQHLHQQHMQQQHLQQQTHMHMHQQQPQQQQQQQQLPRADHQRLRPGLTPQQQQQRHAHEGSESQYSVMSNFSDFSGHGGSGHQPMHHGHPQQIPVLQQQQQPQQRMQQHPMQPAAPVSSVGVDSSMRRMVNHPMEQPPTSAPPASQFYHPAAAPSSEPLHAESSQMPKPMVRRSSNHNMNDNNNTSSANDNPDHEAMNISMHKPEKVSLNDMDRRRVYAKMKYARPPTTPSGQKGLPANSGHSVCDGMPDIYMVESSLSLYSNYSAMTEGKTTSTAEAVGSMPPGVETVKVIDHSARGSSGAAGAGGLDIGSRHSIMSGLSAIDDTPIDANIFSDLGQKLTNVSNRSIAMSEISGYDLHEKDNEDHSSDTGFEHGAMEGTPGFLG